MSSQIKAQKSNTLGHPIEKTDDHREVYSNAVSLASTIWDLSLTFGRSEIKSPGSIKTNYHTTVIMSPQHAKALMQALSRAVDDYEGKYGLLNIKEVKTANG